MFHITYDFKKAQINKRQHGLSFEEIYKFDFSTCHTKIDDRKDYGELRIISVGWYQEKLHTLCYVERDNGIRAISFRRSSIRERKEYEDEKQKCKTVDK